MSFQAHSQEAEAVVRWNASLNPNDNLFRSDQRVAFIIHGYTENSGEPWIQKMKGLLLQKDPNVSSPRDLETEVVQSACIIPLLIPGLRTSAEMSGSSENFEFEQLKGKIFEDPWLNVYKRTPPAIGTSTFVYFSEP